MQSITEQFVNSVNKELWDEATERHKSKFAVPADEVNYIGEIVRGLHVLGIWQREGQARPPESFLRSYSVLDFVIPDLLQKYLGKSTVLSLDEIKPEKREKKWGAFIEWAKLHEAEQFTTEQLVEICGFSYPTTLEYLRISPYFRKIKKGLYEVIDPKTQDK
jgi:hypothetical protein